MIFYTQEAKDLLTKYKDKVPLPIIQVAKDLGVKVHFTTDFDDRKSGQIQKVDGAYHIYLNARHSAARNRFTLAHELGHYLLHKDYLDGNNGFVDYDSRTISLAVRG